MKSLIIFSYLLIMLITYIKIYTIEGFDANTGKWKWYLNMPNVKLAEDEYVSEKFLDYLFRVAFGIVTFYSLLLLAIDFMYGLNTTIIIVTIILLIIDFIYFYHIRSKKKFIRKRNL